MDHLYLNLRRNAAPPAVATVLVVAESLHPAFTDVSELARFSGEPPHCIEMQLGPFAVAQLRILAEIVDLTGAAPTSPTRMFVTDTLADPDDDEGWIPGILAPIAKSRKDANKIKRDEPITVVIGNPPYKEKAKGRGGWIEGQTKESGNTFPLAKWMPPKEWQLGTHSKHLRNLYIYFWRWATWKVFDHDPNHNTGLVCFITVAGFLGGPGFEKMRDYLRRTCDDMSNTRE